MAFEGIWIHLPAPLLLARGEGLRGDDPVPPCVGGGDHLLHVAKMPSRRKPEAIRVRTAPELALRHVAETRVREIVGRPVAVWFEVELQPVLVRLAQHGAGVVLGEHVVDHLAVVGEELLGLVDGTDDAPGERRQVRDDGVAHAAFKLLFETLRPVLALGLEAVVEHHLDRLAVRAEQTHQPTHIRLEVAFHGGHGKLVDLKSPSCGRAGCADELAVRVVANADDGPFAFRHVPYEPPRCIHPVGKNDRLSRIDHTLLRHRGKRLRAGHLEAELLCVDVL